VGLTASPCQPGAMAAMIVWTRVTRRTALSVTRTPSHVAKVIAVFLCPGSVTSMRTAVMAVTRLPALTSKRQWSSLAKLASSTATQESVSPSYWPVITNQTVMILLMRIQPSAPPPVLTMEDVLKPVFQPQEEQFVSVTLATT